MRLIFSKSEQIPIEQTKQNDDNIVIVTQYFLHKNEKRAKEIKYCLQKNCENALVNTVYLLNERIYTQEELGVTDTQMSKIIQINIDKRIHFQDIFEAIESANIQGIIVGMNSDIMVDDTIDKLRYTTIFNNPDKKSMVTLLRYEYENHYVPFETNCNGSKLFGPRPDSQDTWIIHSSQNIPKEYRPMFNIPFGKPGCDNKVVFLFRFLNYTIYNDPLSIKTYHYHQTNIRDYDKNIQLPPIYECICPYALSDVVYPDTQKHTKNYTVWNYNENTEFYNSLKELVDSNKPFVIPAVDELLLNGSFYEEVFSYCYYYFSRDIHHESYAQHGKRENIVAHKFPDKTTVWESLRTVIYFMYHNPWTLALQGKRLLIISPYVDTISKNRANVSVNIFNNNTFSFWKWDRNVNVNNTLKKTMEYCNARKHEYDIALIDADMISNVIAGELYKIGKSSINMGEDLCLLFNVYKESHYQQFPEFFNLKINQNWVKVE